MIEVCEGKGVGSGKSTFATTRTVNVIRRGGTVFYSDTLELIPSQIAVLIRDRFGLELPMVPPSRPLWEYDPRFWDWDARFVEIINQERMQLGLPFVPVPHMPPDDRFPQLRAVSEDDVWRIHEVTAPGTDDNPVLVIIDEAQGKLNARDWADAKKRPLFDFFCQSRHDDNDILILSQHWHNVDKQVQRLATFVWRIRNMANFRVLGLGVWPFKQFRVSQYDADGKTLMDARFISFDFGLFKCFRSKSMRGKHKRGFQPIPRFKLKRVVRKSTSMVKYALGFFALVTIILGISSYHDYQHVRLARSVAPLVTTAAPPPREVFKKDVPASAGKKPVYVMIVEQFRGSDYTTFLDTDVEEYFAGSMSSKGYVSRISHNSAEIVLPSGDREIVVAEMGTFTSLSTNQRSMNRINTSPRPSPVPTPDYARMKSPWFQRDTSYVDSVDQRTMDHLNRQILPNGDVVNVSSGTSGPAVSHNSGTSLPQSGPVDQPRILVPR